VSARDLSALGAAITESARGVTVRHAQRDWLRAVLVAFGFRADVDGDELLVAGRERASVERAVRAALAPEALLFDLDGVLADIARRTVIADVADVEALRGRYPIAVVTTCPRRLAESVLERHGFLPFVDVVMSSDDGPCKPDPFPVRMAMHQLGVETAWMLGDNPSDVTAARGGGAVPLAVTPRGIGAESHADRLRGAGAVRLVDGVASLRALLPE